MLISWKIEEIKSLSAKSYEAGYQFHRDAVLRSPKLLDWVLKENYWDYRLPKITFPSP